VVHRISEISVKGWQHSEQHRFHTGIFAPHAIFGNTQN